MAESQFKSTVIKYGKLRKRNGFIIKKFKSYDAYLLQNGMMAFYTADKENAKYEQESVKSRL